MHLFLMRLLQASSCSLPLALAKEVLMKWAGKVCWSSANILRSEGLLKGIMAFKGSTGKTPTMNCWIEIRSKMMLDVGMTQRDPMNPWRRFPGIRLIFILCRKGPFFFSWGGSEGVCTSWFDVTFQIWCYLCLRKTAEWDNGCEFRCRSMWRSLRFFVWRLMHLPSAHYLIGWRIVVGMWDGDLASKNPSSFHWNSMDKHG